MQTLFGRTQYNGATAAGFFILNSSTYYKQCLNLYRSSAGGPAVRGIYDLGLESNLFSAVRMVVDDESKDNSAEGGHFFYEWFEGKHDIDLN